MESSQFIKIQNFRCFEELEINGFKRVNLIGGKNNSGKTSLLESLLLYFYPVFQSFVMLKRIRQELLENIQKNPENTWNNLFFNQVWINPIKIKGYFENIKHKEVDISLFYAVQPQTAENLDGDENIEEISVRSSSLKVGYRINQEQPVCRRLILSDRGGITYNLQSSRHGIPLIPSSYLISNKEVAELYDKIDYEGKAKDVFNILKILIPKITGLKTYSFIEPTLYIQTIDDSRGLPISLFGDAVYRVVTIVLKILDSDHNCIFIDEIENGIHYTCQKDVWLGLFHLAEKLDTLIFATTHSLEMIKAFAEAGQDFPGQGAYFELAYSPRTQKIIAINRDMDTLQYDLEHGKAIRGE